MRRLLVITVLLCLPAVARADLDASIKAALSDKLLQKAEVGIEIVQLGSQAGQSKVIYKHNPTMPLPPASNLKLATTAAALEKLGPDFKFRTCLVQHDGDLILWGDGDPTLGDVELLRKSGWDVTTVFKSWAELLKKQNITSVRNVIVDDSVFDEQFLHPHWPADQLLERYVAQVGGVNLNANCVDFYLRPNGSGNVVNYSTDPPTSYITVKNMCVGGDQKSSWFSRQPETNQIILRGEASTGNSVPMSVTIHDPPMYAATVLAESLVAGGVQMTGQVKRDRSTLAEYARATAPKEGWTKLATLTTALPTVLARANKDSMNLYAEALCKRLGHEASGASGSWQNGTAAVGAYLKSIGVPEEQFRLDDGCGLSKENAISAEALVRVLTHNFQAKQSADYLSSLAVAGQDGTLQKRFRGTELQGRIFAKSGFISGVRNLSGYLKAKDDQWYAFSILINGVPAGTKAGVEHIQEQILKTLDAQANAK